MKRLVAAVAALAASIVFAPAAGAYLKLGTRVGTQVVDLRFNTFPIRYFITNRDVPGVTAPQLRQSVENAFVDVLPTKLWSCE